MDALRKQLDVLMGANRNGDVAEVNRKYSDRDVCRLYLAGLCPHDLFQLTVLFHPRSLLYFTFFFNNFLSIFWIVACLGFVSGFIVNDSFVKWVILAKPCLWMFCFAPFFVSLDSFFFFIRFSSKECFDYQILGFRVCYCFFFSFVE